MTAATLLGIAAVMAEHADHATGRHVAVTRATIADRVGCSPDTVTVAWRLLRVAGWAVEAQRGHGSPGTPAAGRRPSVYHLVPRREPRPIVHNPVHNPDLPPKAGIGLLAAVGSNSPSAHARPKESPVTTPAARRRYRAEPRPLPVQRLAAQLVVRCHGLDHGHIGAICDTITAAGIDPADWSAHHIVEALNTDMRQTGSSWPDRINNPAAFLSSRLRRLDWRPAGPPTNDGGTAAGRDSNTGAAVQPTTLTGPQRQRIIAAKAHIRATLAAAQTRRTTIHGPTAQQLNEFLPIRLTL